MTNHPSGRVQAHRFAQRRVSHALRTGNPLPPVNTGVGYGLYTVIGVVVTALIVVGTAVYGALRPAPSIGDATVLIDTDAGRVLVVSEARLHPALNLASALLAAGGPGETPTVRQVNSATVAARPRGATIGIANAPQQIPAPDDLLPNAWTVCDVPHEDPARPADSPQPLKTTVVLGASTALPPPHAPLLVTVDGHSHHVLIDGQRRRVPSPADRVLLRALGLRLEDARLISSGLLNTVPEGAAIEWPVVAEAGRSVRWAGREHTVGSVVRVDREGDEPTYHLILADGTQLLPASAVDVVRAVSGLPTDVVVLSPSDLASLPVSTAPIALGPIALGKHLAVSSNDSSPDDQPGLCMHWRGDGPDPAVRIYPVSGVPLPATAHAVPVSALTEGRAHAVYVEPQHGLVVRQSARESTVEIGTLFLITDQGIAYPIVDDQALASLGLGREAAHGALAELISLLPTGPVLDPAAARAGVDPASEQLAPGQDAQ